MLDMKRIKSRMEEILKQFSIGYIKCYKTALVLSIRAKKQAVAAAAGPDWQIMQDNSNLARNPRIEGVLYVGDGLKRRVLWTMGKNYVVTETPIAGEKEGEVAPADGAAAPAPAGDDEESDERVWLHDSCAAACMNPECGEKFGLLKRRTHCRQCGEIFCSDCTKNKIDKDKFCAKCFEQRSTASDPSKLLPVLERPKVKITMYNFNQYKVALHDSELFAKAGAADAAAAAVRPAGAEGKFLLMLTHRRDTRPQLTLAFDQEDERDKWKGMLASASTWAPQPLTLDPLLRPAFLGAYRRCRWYCCVWGGYETDGTEGEMLSELLYDALSYEIFGAELAKLGPLPRRLARKAVVSLIAGGVSAAWAALMKAIGPLRAPLEEAADGLLGPLFEKEKELQDKLQAELSAQVEKALESADATLKEKFGATLPVIGAAGEAELNLIASSLREWRVEVASEQGKPNVLGPWSKYGWVVWRGDWTYSFKSKPISEMIDVKLCDQDASWESRVLASNLKTDLVRLNQSAFFVLRQRMAAVAPNGPEPDLVAVAQREWADIARRCAHDVKIILQMRVEQALDSTVRPPLEQVLAAVIAAMCAPLDALIPEPLKDILDPQRMCNEIIDRLLKEKEGSLVDRAMEKVLAGLEAKGAQIAAEGI